MQATATVFLAALLLVFTYSDAVAEQSGADAAAAKETKKRVLTPEEKAEKASRRACKVDICKALAGEVPPDGTIDCDIVKTWRETDIEDMLGGQIGWPWGKAVCESRLELDRKPLRDAIIQQFHKITLPDQSVICRLEREGDADPYEVVVDFAPVVAFADGKATEAHLNWGDVDAPLAIYPLIYSGTGLDNQLNVLGPEVVEMVNQFTTKKCAEVSVKPRAAPAAGDEADEPAPLEEEEDPGPSESDDADPVERKVEAGTARRAELR